ncbi:sodium:solute symporter family protein [Alphaproteobacteria bacterium]|nr:sodium:solute symporter family protein [Alphaproteobacteria bacterium]
MTPLDIGIVLISLVITLGIGLYKGLGVQTLKDYAVGTELLPTAVLVATIITTLIGGGSSSRLASKVFTYGVPFFLVFLGKPLKILFFAYVVAPRMGPFRHCLSLADMMGRRYGKGGRICTAIACLMRETQVTWQHKGSLWGLCSSISLVSSLTLGVIIGMGTLSTYAAYGGVRSVTATDVFQLCLLVIAAPLIVNFAVLHFEGHFIPLHILKESHFTLPADPDSRKYLLAMAFVYATPVPEGVVIQRFLMANDLLKLKKALLRVALLMIPILLLFSLIGLIAFLLNPMSDPNLSLPLTIYTFMPMGIKGIAVAGIIAVIMSTADSTLHVMSVLLINDIVKPLTKKKLDEKYLVRLIRLSTFIFGCFAIFVGLWFGDVLDIGLFFMDFWAPLIVIPFFAALFGLKAPSKAFLLSAFVGICSVIFWEYSFASYTVIPGFIIGILANSLVFFLMVGIAPQQLKSIRVWPQNLPDIKNNIKKWFDVTSAIWTPATTFGAIALMIYIFPGFLWDKSWASFPQWLWSLKFGGWIICSMLFLSPYWPQAWQRYFKFFWYSALFYTLPFLFSVYVFESQCATPVVTYLMLSLYVLIILVRWQAYLILTTLGIGLTSLIYAF